MRTARSKHTSINLTVASSCSVQAPGDRTSTQELFLSRQVPPYKPPNVSGRHSSVQITSGGCPTRERNKARQFVKKTALVLCSIVQAVAQSRNTAAAVICAPRRSGAQLAQGRIPALSVIHHVVSRRACNGRRPGVTTVPLALGTPATSNRRESRRRPFVSLPYPESPQLSTASENSHNPALLS